MTDSLDSLIAIVPARGGSKRLPRKNVRLLLGKPLISYSIAAGLNCPLVKSVFVSTEDAEIADVSRSAGASVIERPVGLASDAASSRDVVLHALDMLEKQGRYPQHFVLLQPTSPLRTQRHLADCIKLFSAKQFASALSVCEVEHHPAKYLTVDETGCLAPYERASDLGRPVQALGKVYRQNGAIYLMGSDDFRRRAEGFFLEPAMPFMMSQEDSIDIDTPLDLQLAEIVLSHRPQHLS
ncbi:MAG: acylneuraminate cytidylyltransferase family protein [Proteobacteria bacterium]|nr:acylneuraminate cytidylyltransferase family protein [Pseudomonadota bacterium]